jgi:hypothetical protein
LGRTAPEGSATTPTMSPDVTDWALSRNVLPTRNVSNNTTTESFGENDQRAVDHTCRSSLFVRRVHTWLNFTVILLVETWHVIKLVCLRSKSGIRAYDAFQRRKVTLTTMKHSGFSSEGKLERMLERAHTRSTLRVNELARKEERAQPKQSRRSRPTNFGNRWASNL